MNTSPSLPKALMLTIAVVQGLLLFALYKAFETDAWPSEAPLWSYPLWTAAIVIPVLMLLSLETSTQARVTKYSVGFGLLLVLLAIYTGYQAEPFGEFPLWGLSFAFAASVTLACFKALMYLQQRSAQLPMTYDVLFTFSWRNFLVSALSVLLVFIFWLVLGLWGALFDVIGIDFFQELFRTDWFLFPVLAFAFGLGVIVFRNLTHVIDTITKLLHGLLKLLLPLVVLIALIFIVTLPFVGLELLWSTKRGTALLLWLLAIILFFTNAVYQDGRESNPYASVIHKFIYWALWTLPILSGLSLYGLVLRIDQYGWTVERCWAVLVWLVLTLFALGYVWGTITLKSEWPKTLAKVNTLMGLVVLALMVLVNSPILDFRKISLNSQLARLESGEIEIKDFDFHYVKRTLVRPGHFALEKMREKYKDNAEIVELIDKKWSSRRTERDKEEVWDLVVYRPEPFTVPEGLKELVEQHCNNLYIDEVVLIKMDLNADSVDEYVLIPSNKNSVDSSNQYIYNAKYFYLLNGEWKDGNLSHTSYYDEDSDLQKTLKEGAIELSRNKFDNVRIGNILLQPLEKDEKE